MKKILILLLITAISLFFTDESFAQKKSSSFGYKTKSYGTYKTPKYSSKSNTFKLPKVKTNTTYKTDSYKLPKTTNYSLDTKLKIPKSSTNYGLKKPTYKSGSTTYLMGENYKTTGMPKVKRNTGAKEKFLKSKGYDKAPKGYEVDHIIPLSRGGQDEPSNMQLLPKEVHKQKTANERKK